MDIFRLLFRQSPSDPDRPRHRHRRDRDRDRDEGIRHRTRDAEERMHTRVIYNRGGARRIVDGFLGYGTPKVDPLVHRSRGIYEDRGARPLGSSIRAPQHRPRLYRPINRRQYPEHIVEPVPVRRRRHEVHIKHERRREPEIRHRSREEPLDDFPYGPARRRERIPSTILEEPERFRRPGPAGNRYDEDDLSSQRRRRRHHRRRN